MRPARKGRIGTIMITPAKFPANDSLPPLMRSVAMSAGLLAFGKLVPRDIQEAVNLIDRASTYDFNARIQVVRLLTEYPQTRVSHPKRTLYDAVEAAELDEPGAMAALIELKLSANAQFQDRPGACKLIETAVGGGDQSVAQRLADCRKN